MEFLLGFLLSHPPEFPLLIVPKGKFHLLPVILWASSIRVVNLSLQISCKVARIDFVSLRETIILTESEYYLFLFFPFKKISIFYWLIWLCWISCVVWTLLVVHRVSSCSLGAAQQARHFRAYCSCVCRILLPCIVRQILALGLGNQDYFYFWVCCCLGIKKVCSAFTNDKNFTICLQSQDTLT